VKWDDILTDKNYSKEEPENIVAEFIALLKIKKSRILDVGCGAGRHLIYFKKRKFDTYGIDISKMGLKITRERLKQQKLKCNLIRCDMNFLPYANDSFDAAICINTIYHQKIEGIQRTIIEIWRILKKEGLLLVNFLTKRTYIYRKGTEIEKNTYMMDEGIEKGVLHHFTDEKEIKQFFKKFKRYTLKKLEKEINGKLSSRYVVIAKK
jgi:ubiquinone/menaquinone biosynthesis C-methylase UbiE